MKAILMSIKPKWCEKIINGEKTVEVRKTKPKLETPFKVYVYCSAGNAFRHNVNQKVVGEFTCDKIETFEKFRPERMILFSERIKLSDESCVPMQMVEEYANGKNIYLWHIKDFKLYDESKSIEKMNFYHEVRCDNCKTGYGPTECEYDEKCIVPAPVSKAPQSWCYVEEI